MDGGGRFARNASWATTRNSRKKKASIADWAQSSAGPSLVIEDATLTTAIFQAGGKSCR